MLDEHQQQVELTGRERDHHLVRRAQLTAGEVQLPVGEGDQRAWRSNRRRAAFRGAAQYRTYPGQQFPGVERLAQVVVSAHFQPYHAVDQLIHGGQHDHRHRILLAQALTECQPALPRQHQVENDQVRQLALDRCPHRRAIGGNLDFITLLHKEFLQQCEDLKVVVHNQKPVHQHIT
ncbi:hypothetical protein D9M71_364520 [compost metagenome]